MPNLLFEIFILAGCATVITTICHYFKLPTIIGFVITGLVIGPNGLHLVPNLPDVYSLTELASIILMFTIGLEFSYSKLKELKSQFFKLGMSQVLITIAIILGLGSFFTDYPFEKLLVWSFMISLSSTALVLKLLHDYRDLNAPHGQNSIGILLFQDIAVIPMMLVLPFLVTKSGGIGAALSYETMIWGAKLVAVMVVLYFGYKFAFAFIMERVVSTRSHELFFFSIIFICLGIAYLFHWVGLSLSIGAFVTGVIISGSAFGHQTMSIFGALRDTFLGLFFAAIGMLLDINFIAQNLMNVITLGAAFFTIKALVILGVCLVNRTSLAVAVLTTLSITQVGEFSFLIVSQASELNIISKGDNQYFLAISVLSMMFTPILYLLGPKIALSKPILHWKSLTKESSKLATAINHNIKEGSTEGQKKHAHTIVVGYGIAGRNVVDSLSSLKIPYKVIESSYEVVKKNKLKGIEIYFGDASHINVLQNAGLEHARMVVIAISGVTAIPHIIRSVRAIRPDISLVVRAQYVRDIDGLMQDPRISIVVGEIETATELVANVLKAYGIDPQLIYDYTIKARTQLKIQANIFSGNRYKILNLPSWDTLTSIRPYLVDKKDYVVGKRLDALSLPELTGGSIVSIFRPGIGTTIPKRELIIRENDIIHIISSPDAFKSVEGFIKRGIPSPILPTNSD